ncbi:MAG: hypothetical protein ACH37Z_11075 [Anaerolineae bacterium]|nr:hypothetical protein [Ardenticatenia bacterium]
MKQTLYRNQPLIVARTGYRPVPLVLASAALALAGALLSACGSGEPAEPTAAAATAAPTAEALPTEALPTEAPPTEAATATEAPTTTAVATEAPTQAPKPTVAAVVPTTVPAATSVPVATAVPASAWSVEFYPDNWTYQLKKDQLCAGVNWKAIGVTDIVFGAKDSSGEKVEAEGHRGNLCFGEDEAEFFLEYRKPDGQLERKTIKLERDN